MSALNGLALFAENLVSFLLPSRRAYGRLWCHLLLNASGQNRRSCEAGPMKQRQATKAAHQYPENLLLEADTSLQQAAKPCTLRHDGRTARNRGRPSQRSRLKPLSVVSYAWMTLGLMLAR